MATTKDQIADVPLSVDGRHISLYALVAAVSGKPPHEGRDLWTQATRRLKARRLPAPPVTEKGKVPGNRQKTPLIPPQHAAEAVRIVLLEPETFFRDRDCRSALKELLVKTGLEDVSSVDRVAREIEHQAAKLVAQRTAMTLPGFEGYGQEREMRTWKDEKGEVYGSVYDFLRWLGLDSYNDWHNCLKADLQASCNLLDSKDCNTLEITMPGERQPTPMTNFAGFRQLVALALRKSKIARGFADRALEVFGGVLVGDQRLHAEIDANAAAAPLAAREFVLGEVEVSRQELALDRICERHMTRLADKLSTHIDERLAAHARAQEEAVARIHERVDQERCRINLNVRTPKRPSPYPIATSIAGAGRPLPISKYLDEREREDPRWRGVRRSYAPAFGMVMQCLKKMNCRDDGVQPIYVVQNHRPQIFDTEHDRELMEQVWQLTAAHRESLSGPAATAIRDGPDVLQMLIG